MYGFSIPYNKLIKMDDGLVYKALKERQIDVSMGFATDGRISSFGFVVLRDDKGIFLCIILHLSSEKMCWMNIRK
jgi:osmoprotectant transport system substrate-binding protein